MKTFHSNENPWGEMTPEIQQIWEALVYEILCCPKEFRTELEPNLESLKDALLDVIERSHPDYDSAMTNVLAKAMAIPDDAPRMDAKEFKEWLNQI